MSPIFFFFQIIYFSDLKRFVMNKKLLQSLFLNEESHSCQKSATLCKERLNGRNDRTDGSISISRKRASKLDIAIKKTLKGENVSYLDKVFLA